MSMSIKMHCKWSTLSGALLLLPCVLPAVAGGSWGDESNLSLTGTDSETGLGHRPIIFDAYGSLHVVWAEKDAPNQNYRIYSRQESSGSWSAAALAVDYSTDDPGTNAGAKYPSLAPLPNGDLQLFWHDYRIGGINNVEIFTKEKSAGLPWNPSQSADIRLTTTSHPETNGDNGYVPTPVVDSAGALHVLWYDFRFDGNHAEIFSKTREAGEEWDLSPGDSADVRVTNDPDHSELASVAADPARNLHAAWRSAGSGAHVYYAMRNASSGAWSAPVDVDLAGSAAGAPALAIDGAGAVHIVWPDSRDGGRALFTRTRSAGGSWSTAARITNPDHAADEPSLTSDESGALHLVWHDARISLFNREVFHRGKSSSSPWDSSGSADTRLSHASGNSTRPSVAAKGGRVAVLWKDARTGNNDVFVRIRSDPASGIANIPPPGGGAELRAHPNPISGEGAHIARADGAPWTGLALIDVRGRLVRRIEGVHTSLIWDARDDAGKRVPAGVYFAHPLQESAAPARIVVIR
jgi:hypothetical protein